MEINIDFIVTVKWPNEIKVNHVFMYSYQLLIFQYLEHFNYHYLWTVIKITLNNSCGFTNRFRQIFHDHDYPDPCLEGPKTFFRGKDTWWEI